MDIIVASATHEVVWIRNLLRRLEVILHADDLVTLLNDNMLALD